MTRFKKLYYPAVSTDSYALAVSYNAANYSTHNFPQLTNVVNVLGNLEAVYLRFSNVTGSPTITIQISTDTGGEKAVLSDTSVAITDSIGGTNVGACQIKIDVPFYNDEAIVADAVPKLYIHGKIDTGTATLAYTQLIISA